MIGAYGNPGIMPPLVSANASNVPGSGGGKAVCGIFLISNFVCGTPHTLCHPTTYNDSFPHPTMVHARLTWKCLAAPNAFAHFLRHPVPPAPLTSDSGSNWNTELSQSDAINVMWDESSQEYRVYAKTWIDGIDGGMFWKRAVMMHSSKTFLVGSWKVNHQDLCVYPDEFDVGKNPVAGAPYLPGGGSTGVELHAGPVASIGQDLHVMLVQHLDWTSNGVCM